MALLEWVMMNSYVEFDSRIFRQTQGTAMGTPAAVCFAVLFMSWLDEMLTRRWSGTIPLCHVRYIDDGLIIWPGSRAELEEYLDTFNSLDPNIKLTWQISDSSADFLDLVIFKGPRGGNDVATSQPISIVAQMATKHHPNLVRLLGYAVGGHVNTRVENILVYEFIANGDLRHWIAPGRGATISAISPANESCASASNEPISISKWATGLMAEGKTSPLRDPRMEAPEDITIRLAHLAVTCTAMPTASRPSMSRVAQYLEIIREEAEGGDARVRAAARVDEKLSSQRLRRSMEEDLALLNEQVMHEGDTTAVSAQT
ncbi:unnamed protein product [Closterium sp. Naga37s-1]|nr:unnamed protein product [Closterium sp. Naga37s-1]